MKAPLGAGYVFCRGGPGPKEADCLCRRRYWLNWCRGARLSPAAREQGPAVPVCRLCLFASCAVHRPSLELPHQARRCPSLRSWLLRRHTRSCTLQPCPTLAPHNLNPWPRPVCRSRGEGSCEARNSAWRTVFPWKMRLSGCVRQHFPKIAPRGGARGDSFVRCHVKVIRLFRNFTPGVLPV